jgi:hypothetical protein
VCVCGAFRTRTRTPNAQQRGTTIKFAAFGLYITLWPLLERGDASSTSDKSFGSPGPPGPSSAPVLIALRLVLLLALVLPPNLPCSSLVFRFLTSRPAVLQERRPRGRLTTRLRPRPRPRPRPRHRYFSAHRFASTVAPVDFVQG